MMARIARHLSTWNEILFICVKGGLLLFLLATKHCTLAMETSAEKEAVTSMFKLEEVSNIPTYDPTAIAGQVASLMSCVFHCHKLDASSFYYFERNASCLCRSADDNKAENDEAADQKIIYGIRSKKVTTASIQVRIININFIYLLVNLFIFKFGFVFSKFIWS